ncbi:uncharacterized protein [Macrobrachium rosenbergii]|uniref:uncharacterized protein n=1 Tax=Macrobrachium rosenbergii TaxID=79674 RepID=UPI0034D54F75
MPQQYIYRLLFYFSVIARWAEMSRPLLLFFLAAICAFLSVAADKDQNEVAEEKAEGELKDSKKNLTDEEEEEGDEEEEEEEVNNMEAKDLSANLPFHPQNDVSSPLLQELVRSRRPSCSDRKCLRWYQGFWATNCTGKNYKAVAFCNKTGKFCCVRSVPKKRCTDQGGQCYPKCPPGFLFIADGCFGKMECCVQRA